MSKKMNNKSAKVERHNAVQLVEAILNKDLQRSKSLFTRIVNTKLGKQIKKIAQTENLI